MRGNRLAFVLGHMSALAAAAFHRFAPTAQVTKKDLEADFPTRKPFKKASRGRSKQKPAHDRLIVDRSSTVRKMQRWLNAGTMHHAQPKNDRHLMRHSWYRRQKQKEARMAATEA